MKLKDAVYGTMLEKNYEKALSLKNRYSFINANILPLLNKEDKEMFLGFQDVCLKLQKEVDLEDVYEMLPKMGEHYMLQRMNAYDGIPGSCKHQILLSLANNGMAPEVDFAATASAILVGNSLYHNPKRTEVQEKALKEIYRGTKVGGIGITEIEHGSDAVNMKMKATLQDDGSVTYNGVKVYTTNGAVADYFSTYGVTDISNPRRTMMLTMFERGDVGLKTERLHIPAGRGVGIAKVTYDNVNAPAERILAGPGVGYRRLFSGLTPERIAIISGSLAGLWHSVAHGAIFTQIRHQFGKSIFKYQGISHVLDDLYSKTSAYTAFALQIADFYDKKVGHKIHLGEKPDPMDEGSAAIAAAQGKYLIAKLSHHAAYEIVQMCGGRGAIDEPGSNNAINRGENLSRLMEVVGGHRNVQLMIVEAGIKAGTMMAISGNIEKAKREERKVQKEIVDLYMGRADKMLAEDSTYLSEGTKGELTRILSKLRVAIESKDKIEQAAYSKALPQTLSAAGKEVYKAKKA